MKRKSGTSLVLFLIGLLIKTQVQIIGYMGISELFVFLAAPIIYFRDYAIYKRYGVSSFINWTLAVMVSCVLSSVWNHVPIPLFMRGFASCYALFAFGVVFFRLLRQDISAYKWFLLGTAISGVISIYMLQGTALTREGVDINASGDAAVEVITSGALFWVGRIAPFIMLPVNMFYLKCPILYSVCSFLIVAGISLFEARGSGRSSFLVCFIGGIFVAVGRKKITSLQRLKRLLPIYICVILVAMIPLKIGYSYTASHGILGEDAERKFNDQTQRGTDMMSMLISGRTDFFIGLYACLQQPIFGFGPWPADRYGYRAYFYLKYGTDEEIKSVQEYSALWALKTIPAHSHIVGFWLEYGIVGMFFWIYVLYQFFKFMRKNVEVVPQLYGYMALALPSSIWNIFFSPFGSRATISFMVVLILLVDAIRRGEMQLPMEMQKEILRKCK